MLTSARRNLLAQCKYTKHAVLQGDMFIREIFASRRFYETHLGKDFGALAVFTNAKKIGRQGWAAAASHEVQLYERSWILKRLRQYAITKLDVLRRLDKSRLLL